MGSQELQQVLARHNSLSTYFWTTNKQAQITYIWIKLLIKPVFLSSHNLSSSWSQLHSEGGGLCLFLTPVHSQPISHSLHSLHSMEAALTSASSGCPPPPPPSGSLVQGFSNKPISRNDLCPYLIPFEGRKNLWTGYHSHDYGMLDGVMAWIGSSQIHMWKS